MLTKKEKVALFRDRFYGRQDVYGRAWESLNSDGKVIKGYVPVCENFWTSVCHIKLRDGKTCATCVHKRYQPVTDESIARHISGEEKQNFYVLQTDRTTKLGVADFDMKPGREEQGYKFDEVKMTSKFLWDEGIPHCMARSTGSEHVWGHHIYIFFSEFVRGAKVKAALFFTFEKLGFMEQMRQVLRPIPEAFPKQANAGFGIGNGITPGMIEPRFAKERNGLVDENGNFIPADKQWEALAATPRCTPEALDAFIAKYGIEVEDTEESTSDAPGTGYRRDLARSHVGKGGWQQPLTGSIEKVTEGCAAMRAVVDKCRRGEVLGHNEGFTLFHLSMHTADGLEWFKANVPGWGQNERDLRQLEHSIAHNYLPPSCSKLQELNICPVGKKCFDPKPPLILVEGRYVVDEGAKPHAPSPIRYAFGAGDDFLEKLKREVDELANEPDENKKGNKLREIAKRGQVFDEDQQRVLKDHIRGKKLLKAPEVSKIFNRADSERAQEIQEKSTTRNDTAKCGDNVYKIMDGVPGYSLMQRTKDGVSFNRFSECDAIITEEIRYLDEDSVIKNVYKGEFRSHKGITSFEIDVRDWVDNKELTRFFVVLAGTEFNVLRDDLDHFRQAVIAFSTKGKGVLRTNQLVTQGWYQDTYLMPSVLIDKDGVRENKQKVINLSGKHHASFLDFKIVGEDDLRSVLSHILNDFFDAWPRKWTTVCLAHAFTPPVLGKLGIRKKPALFLEGLTGAGKTELLHQIQHFWGEFDSLVNLASTGKGLMTVAHDFKDALLVFDDYKGLDYTQIKALQTVIQYSYDPNSSVKLNRDSSLMKPKQARGLIAFTGEQFIENDAAMVARTILIEVGKQNTLKTMDKYARCKTMRAMYPGVMPHFIHWFMTQELPKVKEELGKKQRVLQEVAEGHQNIDRISHNLSLNHLVFSLFMNFVHEQGVCTNDEKNRLIDEHFKHAMSLQFEMISRCKDDQNGEVFKRVLLQLIGSKEVIIAGFNDKDDSAKNKTVIGFLSKEPDAEPVVNIFPDRACQCVKNASRDSQIRGTEREFGRQFYESGLLVGLSQGRLKKEVRFNGTRCYVWPFKMHELGLDDGKLRPIDGYKNQKVSPEDLPQKRSDGTI